jgi:molybdenum cofactor biosynthesis enzyme MoaA
MIDKFGRAITYLRVSVTDRCDFRCVYCMAEDMAFLPKRDLLTLEELDRLCAAFIEQGVTRLRLTGGEPLVRRDVMWLVQRLGARLGHGLEELTISPAPASAASMSASTRSIRRNSPPSRAGASCRPSLKESWPPRPPVYRSKSTWWR